jgi:hypothetical protein
MPVAVVAHPTALDVVTSTKEPVGAGCKLSGAQQARLPLPETAQNAVWPDATRVNVPAGGVPRFWPECV